MAWADVPAKLTAWMLEEYYMDDGIDRLIADYHGVGSDPETVPAAFRTVFEERLDYYIAACRNVDASRAIDPKLLRG